MSKVLLLGDTHGRPHALVSAFAEAHRAKVDAIIQLGDYGYGWSVGEDGQCDFAYITADMANETGIPFYFIDGNHENFDRLYALPVDENGHRKIHEGVTHLHRGATLTISKTKFLAFGGAYSVDKPQRTKGESWWPQEMITDEEVERGIAAGPADIFLSHDAPAGIQTEKDWAFLKKNFGSQAVLNSQLNQQRVRQVLDASGAKVAYHGHLHRYYEGSLDTGCLVTGINKETDKGSLVIFDIR
jgi:predicted phosphodiesterase